MSLEKTQFRYQNGLYKFENFKCLKKKFLFDFIIFKCYGTSMCGGKKL